jgi:GAF domain-containing protein
MPDETTRFLKEEASRLMDENRDLREELTALRESVRALSALYYLSQEIKPETDVLQLLTDILESALVVLKASDGSLMLVDEETGELVFAVARGEIADELIGFRIPPGQGIVGWVVAHREPQIVRDVRLDPRFFDRVDELFGFNTRSMVAVPLQLDDGRVLGVIEVLNKVSDREFTQDDLDLLLIVAELAATAMRRAERATALHERMVSAMQSAKKTGPLPPSPS